MIRDDIAQQLVMRQVALRQPQRPSVPKPFMPQVPPARSLPPTMIGTPQKVQQAAIQDFLGQAQRAADPFDPYEPDGATVVGRALKKLFFTPEVTGGGAAP
jgi:hypothetical protein